MKIKDIIANEAIMGTITKTDPNSGDVTMDNGKTVNATQLTVGADGKPAIKMPPTGTQISMTQEELPAPGQPAPGAEGARQIPPPDGTNTLFVKQDPAPLIGTMMSDGDGLSVTKTGREIDPAYIQDPANSMNRIGYIKGKDGQMHLALNTGHQWRVGPQAYQAITGHSYHLTREDVEEGKKHKDTIAQGGGDVGGDATDNFINDVKDKEFERAQRGDRGPNARSPINGKKLKETDELYKWLTIAGIK